MQRLVDSSLPHGFHHTCVRHRQVGKSTLLACGQLSLGVMLIGCGGERETAVLDTDFSTQKWVMQRLVDSSLPHGLLHLCAPQADWKDNPPGEMSFGVVQTGLW